MIVFSKFGCTQGTNSKPLEVDKSPDQTDKIHLCQVTGICGVKFICFTLGSDGWLVAGGKGICIVVHDGQEIIGSFCITSEKWDVKVFQMGCREIG